jgi:hypothetical protein
MMPSKAPRQSSRIVKNPAFQGRMKGGEGWRATPTMGHAPPTDQTLEEGGGVGGKLTSRIGPPWRVRWRRFDEFRLPSVFEVADSRDRLTERAVLGLSRPPKAHDDVPPPRTMPLVWGLDGRAEAGPIEND